jgi:hypothetical protein
MLVTLLSNSQVSEEFDIDLKAYERQYAGDSYARPSIEELVPRYIREHVLTNGGQAELTPVPDNVFAAFSKELATFESKHTQVRGDVL